MMKMKPIWAIPTFLVSAKPTFGRIAGNDRVFLEKSKKIFLNRRFFLFQTYNEVDQKPMDSIGVLLLLGLEARRSGEKKVECFWCDFTFDFLDFQPFENYFKNPALRAEKLKKVIPKNSTRKIAASWQTPGQLTGQPATGNDNWQPATTQNCSQLTPVIIQEPCVSEPYYQMMTVFLCPFKRNIEFALEDRYNKMIDA